MIANFSDGAAEYPKLASEQIATKVGVRFSKAKIRKAWEKECRDQFDRERTQ